MKKELRERRAWGSFPGQKPAPMLIDSARGFNFSSNRIGQVTSCNRVNRECALFWVERSEKKAGLLRVNLQFSSGDFTRDYAGAVASLAKLVRGCKDWTPDKWTMDGREIWKRDRFGFKAAPIVPPGNPVKVFVQAWLEPSALGVRRVNGRYPCRAKMEYSTDWAPDYFTAVESIVYAQLRAAQWPDSRFTRRLDLAKIKPVKSETLLTAKVNYNPRALLKGLEPPTTHDDEAARQSARPTKKAALAAT